MRGILAALAFASSIGSAGAETVKVDLTFKVWFGGLELAEIETGSRLFTDRYSVNSSARSVGVLSLVYDFETRSEARGVIVNGSPVPLRYQSDVSFGDDKRVLVMSREPGGVPQIDQNPPYDPADRDPVPSALQQESIDPLSAILRASLGWTEGDVCTGTLPVFNGRTRTNISFEPVGPSTIPASDYSAYSGDAVLCTVRWRVIAGAYKRKWPGLGKTFPDAKLWVAQVGARRHWVPVRLEADAFVAPVIVHLVGLSTDMRQVSGAKTEQQPVRSPSDDS